MTLTARRRRILHLAAVAAVLPALSSQAMALLEPHGERRSRLLTVEEIQRRKADFEIDFFGFRYQGNTGNLIDAHTYYFGAYEKPELYFLRDTLTVLGPDAVVVDVGANTGLHSLFASRYAKQVHAFEPYPPILTRLRRVLQVNNVPNVIVHPVGLGQAEASLPFYEPSENNLGTGSFVHGFGTANHDGHEELRIVAGDAYFPQAGLTRVDLIKMDIEGYEKPALAGLRQVLEHYRPILLLEISINPAIPHLFSSIDELRSYFPEDYEFLAMSGRDLVSGAYRLEPLRLPSEGVFRLNGVVRPTEKAGALPLASEGRRP